MRKLLNLERGPGIRHVALSLGWPNSSSARILPAGRRIHGARFDLPEIAGER